MTSKPSSAMHAAWVAPRYPVPSTLSFSGFEGSRCAGFEVATVSWMAVLTPRVSIFVSRVLRRVVIADPPVQGGSGRPVVSRAGVGRCDRSVSRLVRGVAEQNGLCYQDACITELRFVEVGVASRR